MSLSTLIGERSVLVCVGSGGVGKTTTAASLGLGGARAGKRTLVLTIDPAKRLADALGIDSLGHDPQRVALPDAPGELWAMMLDQKRAFDELVERYTPDPAARERLLGNAIYRQISTSLAGAHEYAAMSKLDEIVRGGRYELVILDTPPTTNALDFLEAPERLTAAIDSPAIRWLVEPYLQAGRFSLRAVGVGAAFVLRRLARFVGSAFLEEMARFFAEFHAVVGGFRERAREVHELLRRPDVAVVLVSSPQALAVEEAVFFYQQLVAAGLFVGAFVINRVHPAAPEPPSRAELIGLLSARPELRGSSPDEVVQVAADLERTHREFLVLAQLDAHEADRLRQAARGRVPLVEVPLYDHDVYDLKGLDRMVQRLTG